MTLRQTGMPGASEEDDLRADELTTGGVLRMLGAGASGSILMALGDGPLRTKELTERVPGYTPRTVYRYASKLARMGVVERHEEPGVPSKVVHSLIEPSGRELHDLVEGYANVSLSRLPGGQINSHDWGSLTLLADLWDSGMIEALNGGARSPTELARGDHGWSFHQVSRRARLFAIGGFLEEIPSGARRRRYALTTKARRAMALIAGIGRWRRRHVVPEGRTGLSAGEVVDLMRTVLPLVSLPSDPGKSFEIRVSPKNGKEEEDHLTWAWVEADGSVLCGPDLSAPVDASAVGTVPAWVDTVLDGPRKGISVEGDVRLIGECLRRLHTALWGRGEEPEAQPALAGSAR